MFYKYIRMLNNLYRKNVIFFSLVVIIHLYLPVKGSGGSLYEPKDKIVLFTNANWNFASEYDGKVVWLIQFYHHACGHCITYSEHFKKFAASIYEWERYVKLGTVDCADEYQLCTKYDIQEFPTLRYFQKNRLDGKGVACAPEKKIESLQHQVLNLLKNSSTCDFLKPIDNKSGIFKFSYIIIYGAKPLASKDILLRLHGLTTYPLYWSDIGRETKADSVVVLVYADDNVKKSPKMKTENVYDYLVKHFIRGNNRKSLLAKYSKEKNNEKLESHVKPIDPAAYKGVSRVYYDDMVSAVVTALHVDITLKGNLNVEELSAVKKFLSVLVKYFPCDGALNKSLIFLYENVKSHSYLESKSWLQLIEESKLPINRANVWLGCRGSKSYYRGYPCGLWTLFHSLTVQQYILHPESSGAASQTVLSAMQSFITKLFSCTHCGQNFEKETQSLATEVTNSKSAVLYLWKVHNNVNKRLAGADSQDPIHPKVSFPTQYQCEQCRNGNKTVNEKILKFLVSYYGADSWIHNSTQLENRNHNLDNNYLLMESIIRDDDNSVEFKPRHKFQPDITAPLFFAVLLTLVAVVFFYCYVRRKRPCSRRRPSLSLNHHLTKSA